MKIFPILILGFVTNVYAGGELAEAALERIQEEILYDGSYRQIPYPNGDVPSHIGVCTDLVIRSYRSLGTDLQRLVHEDMTRNFERYPQSWGLLKPDSNIDHRRVPNLETFFTRQGHSLSASSDELDYLPGDIVTWRLGGSLPHIGIVGRQIVPGTNRHYIIHNVGRGPKNEDVLFEYPLHGHFRYAPG
jgi:uncharacterized protein YijF (DUF1287 family)